MQVIVADSWLVTLHYGTYSSNGQIQAGNWSLYSSQIYEKDAEKWCVLRFDLDRVLDDVASDRRVFHVFAVATGKAQPPVIQSREGSWISQISF